MMGFSEHDVIQFFVGSAYNPWTVYGSIALIMYASAFGFPLPEEIPILGAGLVGHVASNPQIYPPPYQGATGVNLYFLAFWCFFAVLSSDLVIFFLGRFTGKKLNSSARFKRITDGATYKKIQQRIRKNGIWASAIFRFIPGIRFPGHLACGAFGIPTSKFIAVDGTAALLTVPTQVLLVGIYGDTILKNLRSVKLFILGVIAILVIVKLASRFTKKSAV
jgi:membrane protein DedA with SNARE-associated domain